jgi:hypothetical protein
MFWLLIWYPVINYWYSVVTEFVVLHAVSSSVLFSSSVCERYLVGTPMCHLTSGSHLSTQHPYSIPYLLAYSMEQSPSWEANQFATSQEIPSVLLNPKVHYRVHKCLPLLYPEPAQSSPYPTSHFLKIYNGYRVFPWAKVARAWHWPPTPI